MTLQSALILAIVSGAVSGMLVAWVRTTRRTDDFAQFPLMWVVGGVFVSALIFGAQIALSGVLYFLLGASSPLQMLKLTVVTMLLLGMAGAFL